MKKNIIFLGANSDIAIATAHKFAKEGYTIQLASRDIINLEKIKSELINLYKIDCFVHKFDVLNVDGHIDFFNNLSLKPNIVVCAVGLFVSQMDLKEDYQMSKKIMNTNFIGPALALEAAAKFLKSNNEKSCIVGISSVSGDRGRSKTYTYGSSKAGFNEYLSGLRQKYNNTNVNIITMKPGFVKTKMSKNIQKPNFFTSTKEESAEIIYKACETNKNIVYTKRWRLIMQIIKLIPENFFKKLKF